MAEKKKWVPSPEEMEDFKAVRKALLKFYKGEPARVAMMNSADTNKAIKAWEEKEAADYKVVQLAFIHATRDVNHADRWPLVNEMFVLRTLLNMGLGVPRPKHYGPSAFAGHGKLFAGE